MGLWQVVNVVTNTLMRACSWLSSQLIQDFFWPAAFEGTRVNDLVMFDTCPSIVCAPLLQPAFLSLTSNMDACRVDAYRALLENLAGIPGAIANLAIIMTSTNSLLSAL